MTITLPYKFDSAAQVRPLLYGVFALLAIVVIPGLIKFLVIVPNLASAFGIAVIGCMLSYIGYIMIRQLYGATGTITKQEVITAPNRFVGIASREPEGRFALDQFDGLLVEQLISNSMYSSNIFYERVVLTGTGDTPNILLARTRNKAGLILARELGVVLNLPVEDKLSAS